MNLEAFVSGSSLAMDALAISICIGALRSQNYNCSLWSAAWKLGTAAGSFQFFMPLLGWWLGEYAAHWVSAFDHWLAFVLLAYVGGNMIRESFHEEEVKDVTTSVFMLLSMALATSIDAFTVGASFAFAGLPVMPLAVIAGGVTALLCVLGVYIGRFVGNKLGPRVEFLGGLLLVGMGVTVLISHLF